MIKNRTHLLLTLLYSGETENTQVQRSTPIEGITRLEKLLFLLQRDEGFLCDAPAEEGFTFVPFRMGPWTHEVYDELDFLESLGLVESRAKGQQSPEDAAHEDELIDDALLDKYRREDSPGEEATELYRLTQQGRDYTRQLWSKIPDDEKRKIIKLKRKFNTMNLKQFLRYVYKKYPQFATESEIRDYLRD